MSTIFFLSLINLNLDGLGKVIAALILLICSALAVGRIRFSYGFLIILFSIYSIVIFKFTRGYTFTDQTSFESLTPILVIFYPFAKYFAKFLDRKSIGRILIGQSVIFLIDLFIRVAKNGLSSFINPDLRFFSKMGGLYHNSNIAGQISSLLVVLLLVMIYQNRKMLRTMVFFSITSMSRTAWVVVAQAYFMRLYNAVIANKALTIALFLPVVALLSALVYLVILPKIMTDGSFQSKLVFISIAFEVAKTMSPEFLWWGGNLSASYAVEVIDYEGFSPHNPFIKVFLYYGLVGLISFIIFNLFLWKKLGVTFFIAFLMLSFAGFPILHPIQLFLLAISSKFIKSERRPA